MTSSQNSWRGRTRAWSFLSTLTFAFLSASTVCAYGESGPTEWTIHNGQGYQVRTKPTSPELCAGEPGISGYVDWDNNHLFFWAFESRNDPSKDPVLLWLTGGPGGSGITFGALQELGPCVFFDPLHPTSAASTDDKNSSSPVYNPWAWNTNATVIFVDQPVGVGLSYSTSKNVTTLREATRDLYAFLERLFTARPDWGERDFYIVGESYGGSWGPSLAAEIQAHRTSPLAKLAAATSGRGLTSINFKGMSLGNAMMDQFVQRRGLFQMGCEPGPDGSAPVLNTTQCKAVVDVAARCEQAEEACKASGFNHSVCAMSDDICHVGGWTLISDTPWFPYDVRVNCTAEPAKCDLSDPRVGNWLNSKAVRQQLGVDEATGPVVPISQQISADFQLNGEVGYPSHQWVTQCLNEGIRVLIYAGNKDWLCNAPGMRYFADSLEWENHVAFRAEQYLPVHAPVAGKRRLWGFHKRHSLLSSMEVDQAGHMVPKDQPEVSNLLLNYWIAGYL